MRVGQVQGLTSLMSPLARTCESCWKVLAPKIVLESTQTSGAVLRLNPAFQVEEASRMKPLRIFLLSAMLILAVTALGQGTKTDAVATVPHAQSSQAAPTLASAIDREISAVEKQVLDAAEAMPEDKFNFSPESLHLPGGNYTGV